MIEFPDVKCMNILCFVIYFPYFQLTFSRVMKIFLYFEFLSGLCSGPGIWPLTMSQLTSADLLMTECLSMCLNIFSGNCRLRAACALTRSALTQPRKQVEMAQTFLLPGPGVTLIQWLVTRTQLSHLPAEWISLDLSLSGAASFIWRVTCLLLVKKKQWESLQISKLCGRN